MTTGRNLLLEYALNNSRNKKDNGYLYYIFLDADILLRVVGATPWEELESFIIDPFPAVGYFLNGRVHMFPFIKTTSKYSTEIFNVDAT